MSATPSSPFKAVIAVASGKGGVGKSTVAVNLACALKNLGHSVGLLDADIYGPSQHIMMGLSDTNPIIGEDRKIVPLVAYGITMVSFGFFVKAEEAVVWRGPMVSRMLQQFVSDVRWPELDYLIVDLPPGTGDIQLTLTTTLQVTGAVIVTTPQDVALADAVKGINMFRKVDVDVLGLIENMSTFACPSCGHEAHIFSSGGGQKKAKELGVPFLGSLPLEEATRVASDAGNPIVLADPQAAQSRRFLEMARTLHEAVIKLPPKAPKETTPPAGHKPGFEV